MLKSCICPISAFHFKSLAMINLLTSEIPGEAISAQVTDQRDMMFNCMSLVDKKVEFQ